MTQFRDRPEGAVLWTLILLTFCIRGYLCGGVVMGNFLRIVLVNGDVVMFPIDEVVDVVGCLETLEVQILRCCDGVKMPYKVKVLPDGEIEAARNHWLSTLNNIQRQLTV